VGYQVFRARILQAVVFWVTRQSTLTLLTLTIKMEVRKFSETTVTTYKITRFNDTKIKI